MPNIKMTIVMPKTTGERSAQDVLFRFKTQSFLLAANDGIEPLAANRPSYTAGRYRESAPLLG